MHAATVDLLVQKAHLEPDTALAIATAIDMAIHNAQLVTVAILDARFAAFESKMDARFAAMESKMDGRFAAMESEMDARFTAMESEMDTRFTAFEFKIDARFAASKVEMDARFTASEAKSEARFAAIDSRFTASEAKMEAALEKTKAELVRWVFLVMLGNVALTVAANAVLSSLQHMH